MLGHRAALQSVIFDHLMLYLTSEIVQNNFSFHDGKH